MSRVFARKGAKARRLSAQLIVQFGTGAAGTVELMADWASSTGKFPTDDGRAMVLTIELPVDTSEELTHLSEFLGTTWAPTGTGIR